MVSDGNVVLQPPGWMGETPFAISVPHGYHRIKISFIQIEEIGGYTCLLVHMKLKSMSTHELSFRSVRTRKQKQRGHGKAGTGALRAMVLF